MKLNVFYTGDHRFAPQIAAAMTSVCETNQDAEEIHFYLGCLGMDETQMTLLSAQAEKYNRDAHMIILNDLKQSLDFSFDTQGWNEVVLARLLVDKLLPESVEKVLYMDGDTIVTGSLEPLWNMDLNGCVIAMRPEATANRSRREALGLVDIPYCNSGVLLIDLNKWRAENTGKKILTYYKEKGGNLFAPDQDAINGALKGEIAFLSPAYNYCNTYYYYPYRLLKKLSAPAPFIDPQSYREAVENPVIIHYLGEDRPWRRGTSHKYAAEYHRSLSKTPWSDAPLEEGWELYLFLFRMFHIILKPFPSLRYHIIDGLIPLFMKYRKAHR